jgi:hypothetical protein
MLETLLMGLSLLPLGYAFYISSRMFWSSRTEAGPWRWIYTLSTAFIFATYLLFSVVMFSFIASIFYSFAIFHYLNTILALFLLLGAGAVSFAMRYHLSIMTAQAAERVDKVKVKYLRVPDSNLPKSRRRKKEDSSGNGTDIAALRAEVKKLRKELEDAKKLNKLAVGREFRIMQLKKEIERLHGGKVAVE